MLQERQGEAMGFSESEHHGTASGSSLEEDGNLQYSIEGKSPQGEQGTPAVCEVLLARMKELGYPYDTVLSGSEPADCVFADSSKRKLPQEVQVARASVSQGLWQQLRYTSAVNRTLTTAMVVKELCDAIQLKERKLVPSVRCSLVLALDATRLPGFGFDRIVQEFRRSQGSWAASLGFKSIWLVGPITRLTWRLDSEHM